MSNSTVTVPGLGSHTVSADGKCSTVGLQPQSGIMKNILFTFSTEFQLSPIKLYKSVHIILGLGGTPYLIMPEKCNFVLMTDADSVQELVPAPAGSSALDEQSLLPAIGHRLKTIEGGSVRPFFRAKRAACPLSFAELELWARDGEKPKLLERWFCSPDDLALSLDPATLVPYSKITIYLPPGVWEAAPKGPLNGRAAHIKKAFITDRRMRYFSGKRALKISDELKAALGEGEAADQKAREMWDVKGIQRPFSVETSTPTAGLRYTVTPSPSPTVPRQLKILDMRQSIETSREHPDISPTKRRKYTPLPTPVSPHTRKSANDDAANAAADPSRHRSRSDTGTAAPGLADKGKGKDTKKGQRKTPGGKGAINGKTVEPANQPVADSARRAGSTPAKSALGAPRK